MQTIITPQNLFFGENSTRALKKFITERSVIVAGKSWSYFEDYVESIIGKNYTIIHGKRSSPTEEPREEDVEKLVEELRESKPDIIVALGGGSIIDMSKAAAIFLSNEGLPWNEFYLGRWSSEPVKLIAIETTSGTGSGVSAATVVIRGEIKKGVVHKSLVPYVSIYDPYYTRFMSPEVSKISGMDALTHAIEAYTSNVENIISDTLALEAVRIISENLEKAIAGDFEARKNMHYANMLAGIGFTNSRLTVCHAISHKLGVRLNLPHGILNATFLPAVVEENVSGAPEKFEKIARIFGVDRDSLGSKLREINSKLGICNEIRANVELELIAEEVMGDKLVDFNPVKLTKESVIRILKKVIR